MKNNCLYIKLNYKNKEFYVFIDNIDQYQKIYYKEKSIYSFDFINYKYVFKVVEYLYKISSDITLVDFELEIAPKLDCYESIEFSALPYLYNKLYITNDFFDKFFYLLNPNKFINLFSNNKILSNEGDVINFDQKISFNVVSGTAKVSYQELSELKSGDVIILDEVFLSDNYRIIFSNQDLTFKKENQDLIFKGI